ncbi:TonB-dependent receptor domain-containing protein [Bowmanella dokdonensis]|uniref:TonB-dependent receptor n=1 Tax=Bowmanella dokdonensis TaxID=751969 RepID=A0A939IRA2_9ALTE|nr:TonB-dependent receptor [Bowmanella dokdonensis]MBN7825437.1 TonB-dependent receptor [Bowmanella dokdonensis]
MTVKPLPLAISLLFTSTALLADDGIEHLQVWGTQVKSSSVYVGEQDIAAKQVDHLSDLLRDIPGVDVGGTHSLNQRINIRGLDDTDLAVIIDGASQNNYMFHHMGNLLLNPDLLKSVDIQVGTNSVVHSGLGGAVEFRTKQARDLLMPGQQFGGRVLVGINSNASRYLTLTGFGQLTDSVDLLVYGSAMNRDNFEDGEGVEVLGSDGNIYNGMIKLGWTIDANQRLSFKYDAYRDKGDYTARPDMGVRTNAAIGNGEVPLYPTEFDRDTLSAHYELELGSSLDLRADLYQNKTNLWRIYSPWETEGTATNTGLNLIANSKLTGAGLIHQLTYGLKWQRSDTDSFDTNGTVLSVGGEQSKELALFVEDELDFGNGLYITPGLRFNRYSKTPDVDRMEDSWTEWQSALATEYRFDNGLTLLASTTELFKGPQLGEVFINEQSGKVRNPDLEPETGRNNELGLRYHAGDKLGADQLTFAFTRFDTRIEGYIEPVDYPLDDCSGRGCVQWDQNLGEVEIQGFEASLLYVIGNLDALLTYADSDSRRIDGGSEAQPLEREVGDSAGISLSYLWSEYDLSLSWQLQHTRREGDKPSYHVHTLSASWAPSAQLDGLTLTLGVENLFDEFYVSHASRTGFSNHPVFGVLQLDDYEPGRNIKVSAAYHF